LAVDVGAHTEDSTEYAEHQTVATSTADLGDILIAQKQAGIFNPHEWSFDFFNNYPFLRFFLTLLLLLLLMVIHLSPACNITKSITHDGGVAEGDLFDRVLLASEGEAFY
jgi:hypothetical protein